MTIPSIPKGTRDFGPDEIAYRNYIFQTIKDVFENHGFQPIETPAMENLSTLLGKYGEEGDKLIFKILNSGDFIGNLPANDFVSSNVPLLSNKICEKGLRYDLTVPFARYVVQHRHELVFPFRRYQIQPVWRADRPQKGRYREFYQCDADIIGSNSLLNEYELIQIIDEVFTKLQIKVKIKINNRKILAGIAEIIGCPEKFTEITIAIDKLEKVGINKVKAELIQLGININAVDILINIFSHTNLPNEAILELLSQWLSKSEVGLKGIEELKTIFSYLQPDELLNELEIDLSLARGLNYYTGAIFEVKALDVEMGSISGGGRYDNLTSIFGLDGISGVGISFGADRIFDILLQKEKFPKNIQNSTKVMFVNFNDEVCRYILPLLKELHSLGIAAELYPDFVKIKKQLSYANAKKIPFIVIAGEDEISQNKILIKRMADGNQFTIEKNEFISYMMDMLNKGDISARNSNITQ